VLSRYSVLRRRGQPAAAETPARHSSPAPHPGMRSSGSPCSRRTRARHDDGRADAAVIAAQLGRPPRGLLGVAHRCPCGLPDVAETAPRLPDGSPFPTLYYLTCPRGQRGGQQAGGLGADARHDRAAGRPGAARPGTRPRIAITWPAGTRRRGRPGSSRCRPGTQSAGGMPERVKCLHALAAHELAVGDVNPFGREALDAGR